MNSIIEGFRVKRIHILFAFIAVSTLLYAVQFYLFKRAEGLETYSPQHARLKSRAYQTVLKFVNLTEDHQITPILVDPFILQELIDETMNEAGRPCRFLCKNHVYTFAIVDNEFNRFNERVLHKLANDGFKLSVTYQDTKRQETPTHILLRDHENHALHIVLFYLRNSLHQRHQIRRYFWYGANPDDDLGLDFSNHEGLIDYFRYPKSATIDGVHLALPYFPKKFVEEYQSSRFIPCNKRVSEQFHSKYPRDLSPAARQFREKATTALRLAKKLLDELEIPFWLSSGTLLGWYRQCDFIVYSGDVDIGLFIKDHKPDFMRQMKQAGMHLLEKFGKVSDSLQYAYDMGDIKLDMFFFYEEADHMWNGGTGYEDGTKYKYTFPKFTLCWTEFMDMKFRVPCETEVYLRANYGPNWTEPNKNWDWKTSPFNVKEVAPWHTDELDEVIQLWDKHDKRVDLSWEEVNDEL